MAHEAQTLSVAVVGTGMMGAPMARNLARAGLRVRAWNRTREHAEPLAGDGIEIADTAAAAADGADVLVTMLSDADAVQRVTSGEQGPLAAAQPPRVWLQMGTIGLAGTEWCIALAGERGLAFFDAPVLGTRQPAEQGELVVLASGPEEQRELAACVFDAVGRRTLWLGDAGAGTRMKLVTNSWIVALVEGLAEALALAEALGLDPAAFLDVIRGGPLDVPYAQLKGRAMIERDFTPSFKLALAAKDARLAREAAAAHGLELPLLQTVAEQLTAGAERGHGDEDLSAAFLAVAPGARQRR